jgi:hypothetical protein
MGLWPPLNHEKYGRAGLRARHHSDLVRGAHPTLTLNFELFRPDLGTLDPESPEALGRPGSFQRPPARLRADDPLAGALRALLPGALRPPLGEISLEPLRASRPVYRFVLPHGHASVVAKFFYAYPPASSQDRGLAQEYHNYFAAVNLGVASGLTPRLLGRWPHLGLGLLLEDIPGPDLDSLLARAVLQGERGTLDAALEKLAGLLAFFHTRPLPVMEAPVAEAPAYLEKIRGQLQAMGLLSAEDDRVLQEEGGAWPERLRRFPDRRVWLHGDATPTNFLFPNGRAVAVDLERLRPGDRLWDLSYVAGELKHAWGWRTGDFDGAEPAIRRFFAAYLEAVPDSNGLAERLHRLNPFYMALGELRIARNDYLSRSYRLSLIAEARRCLAFGRRML